MEIDFTAPLWLWPGDAAWHFVSLPEDAADEIRERFGSQARGFGSVRVRVRVGTTSWATSVFPDSKSGTYVLPVKRLVRDQEGLAAGDEMRVHLEVVAT